MINTSKSSELNFSSTCVRILRILRQLRLRTTTFSREGNIESISDIDNIESEFLQLKEHFLETKNKMKELIKKTLFVEYQKKTQDVLKTMMQREHDREKETAELKRLLEAEISRLKKEQKKEIGKIQRDNEASNRKQSQQLGALLLDKGRVDNENKKLKNQIMELEKLVEEGEGLKKEVNAKVEELKAVRKEMKKKEKKWAKKMKKIENEKHKLEKSLK